VHPPAHRLRLRALATLEWQHLTTQSSFFSFTLLALLLLASIVAHAALSSSTARSALAAGAIYAWIHCRRAHTSLRSAASRFRRLFLNPRDEHTFPLERHPLSDDDNPTAERAGPANHELSSLGLEAEPNAEQL